MPNLARVSTNEWQMVIGRHTIKQSAMCASAPLYAASLTFLGRESSSTALISQFTISHRYKLDCESGLEGVQSQSANSKKSLVLSVMVVVRCVIARGNRVLNALTEVRRIAPPRCVALHNTNTSASNSRRGWEQDFYRNLMSCSSSSEHATWKCSIFVIT